ncbi:MAG: lipopolysaccharide heptosyltransferase II [Negativicutes bacterium]|jgi:lipopolysaccharide heptosyltransferase II
MKKILVINLMPLGDLLLTTPFLRALRNLYPDSSISLLADARWSDVVRLNPCIDEFIALDKKRDHDNLFKQLRFVAFIRKKRFDLVVNLHYNERSSMIAVCSGAKLRIGYANRYFAPFMDMFQENRCLHKHIVESHYDILREKLLIPNDQIVDAGLELVIGAKEAAIAELRWNTKWKNNAPERVIALNIGASWPTKRWPVEYFSELATKLIAEGYAIAFFGSAPERELVEKCVAFIAKSKQPNSERNKIAVFTGELSLMELAACLKKCVALVTNDSGPLHIAVSQGVPTLSFYGPSPVPGFAPYNNYSVVLKSALACHPCRQWECPSGTLECMYNITPEMAYAELNKLLEEINNGLVLEVGAFAATVHEY